MPLCRWEISVFSLTTNKPDLYRYGNLKTDTNNLIIVANSFLFAKFSALLKSKKSSIKNRGQTQTNNENNVSIMTIP